MKFTLELPGPKISEALLEISDKAPREYRATILTAVTQLEQYYQLCEDGAAALRQALALKAGLMDTDSRIMDLAKQIRVTMADIEGKMREANQRCGAPIPADPADEPTPFPHNHSEII